jgi:hypothetical protein
LNTIHCWFKNHQEKLNCFRIRDRQQTQFIAGSEIINGNRVIVDSKFISENEFTADARNQSINLAFPVPLGPLSHPPSTKKIFFFPVHAMHV